MGSIRKLFNETNVNHFPKIKGGTAIIYNETSENGGIN